MNDEGRRIPALLLVFLMLISSLASAATTTTNFSNGSDEAFVEIKEALTYSNSIDGSVSLPAGDTVTSATINVATTMTNHSQLVKYDSSVNLDLWDPAYNNQQTFYSNKDDFTYTDKSLKLVSDGFTSDFEGTNAGFQASVQPPAENTWEHGKLANQNDIDLDCNSGDACWGTNIFDDYYPDDAPTGANNFDMEMHSPSMYVSSTGYIAKFASFHSLFWNNSGTNATPANAMYDCAYVKASSSINGQDWGGVWNHLEFDITNSSGIGYTNGLYPVGSGTNKIQTCDGVPTGSYALGGTSKDPQINANGWGTMALNLQSFIGKYVRFIFVLERNNYNGRAPETTFLPGWYIDDFRLGNPLPQFGSVTVEGFTASQIQGQAGYPDGYGILHLEVETTPTNSLTIDVMNAIGTEVVVDNNGNALSGLEGSSIELWDINTSLYPQLQLRFNFDSGIYRLSTPILHAIHLGSRVGSGLNDSNSVLANPPITDNEWVTSGIMGENLMYFPILTDNDLSPVVQKGSFSQPITGITPVITDDCSGDPTITLDVGGAMPESVTEGEMWTPDEPIFAFLGEVSYNELCTVTGVWFDLQFGFSPSTIRLDIAGDGDIEWGFDEPAFGHFGLQDVFWNGINSSINQAIDSKTVPLGVSGMGQGGTFMLPKGAQVLAAELAFDQNTIHSNIDDNIGFDLELLSGNQNETLGEFGNLTEWTSDGFNLPIVDFKTIINNLLVNPMVPTSHIDAYGNEWISLHFKITSPDASTGSSLRLNNLIILYDWQTTLGSQQNLVRELSQGISSGIETAGVVEVPINIQATSGGALRLANLSVTSTPGYSSTLSLSNSPEGLYPDGSIIEAISYHLVDSSTGTTFSQARLRIESSSGAIELGYSDVMGFWEVEDEDDLISLQSSAAVDVQGAKEISWRFTINPSWGDAAEARIYASLIADNGVEGIPGAVILNPSEGNAIENDAGITNFEIQNSAGEAQSLSDGQSNQLIRLIGSIELEGLDTAPDPSAYRVIVEILDINSTDPQNIIYTWLEIENTSGPIGGDFNWLLDLGEDAAGTEDYRFRMAYYAGGDTLCPPIEYGPDESCAIPFTLTIDNYGPSLNNTEVWDGSAAPGSAGGYWRDLLDDTWVSPSQTQWFKFTAQDIEQTPSNLTLHFWVQKDDDANDDGQPQESEYRSLVMLGDGEMPTSNYSGFINDKANDGFDGKVSLYLTGYDLAGNPITRGQLGFDPGMPGFDHDMISYVSMGTRNPGIENFKIGDSNGNEFDSSNKTMYAGNEYHLIIEGRDENGWRDIQWFEIDLNPGVSNDMILKYWPRNNTVSTDSLWIEVIAASNESAGTKMVRRNGNTLIDPFETEFKLDMPIRLAWNCPTASGVMAPQVRIKDHDPNLPSSVLTESNGHYKQRWIYGDGFQLDTTTLSLDDMTGPSITNSVYNFQNKLAVDYVFSGDTVQFSGQYAFVDGYPDVVVNPELTMTMIITRKDASADSSGNEQLSGEITHHEFTDGTFAINLTAPSKTNAFSYSFSVDSSSLPDGAVDHTTAVQEFTIKVDSSAPEVIANTWQVTDTRGATLVDGEMPSSSIHCVNVQLMIKEQERLSPDSIFVNWMFFQNGDNWSIAEVAHGGSQSQNLSLEGGGSQIVAKSFECIDLWPDDDLPSKQQLQNVIVRFWVTGSDSAGLGISGGGSEANPITGLEERSTSEYSVVYQQAEYEITRFKVYPSSPEVGQDVQLDINIKNVGNTEGVLEMKIEVVSASDGARAIVAIVSTDLIGVYDGTATSNTYGMEIDIEPFREAKAGLHFEISDNQTGALIWSGLESAQTMNVAVASQTDDSLPIGLILAGLGGLIAILVIVVMVLVLRGRGEGEYDEYEDEKSYPSVPYEADSGYGGGDGGYGDAGAGYSGGGYGAPGGASPEMQQALAEFPQWDQQTIQSYFDMGWSLEQLRDWVRSNQG